MAEGTLFANKAVMKFNGDTIGRIKSMTVNDSLVEIDVSTLNSLADPDSPLAVSEPTRNGGIAVNRHQYVGFMPSPEFSIEVTSSSNSTAAQPPHNIPGYTDEENLGPIGQGWGDKPQGVIEFDWAGDGSDIERFELEEPDPNGGGFFPQWKLLSLETAGALDGEITTSYTFGIVETE